MAFDLKAYMVRWRAKNSGRLSISNRAWREANPHYAKAWRDKHPDYQRLYRSKDPNHRKLWNIRFPNRSADEQAKAKVIVTHMGYARIPQLSLMKPMCEEYAEFPIIAQQIMKLNECKYLKNNKFCNLPRQPGKPYCTTHMNMCYLPVNPTTNQKKHKEHNQVSPNI